MRDSNCSPNPSIHATSEPRRRIVPQGAGWSVTAFRRHLGTGCLSLLLAGPVFAQYRELAGWLIYDSPSPATTPVLEVWVDDSRKRPTTWRLMSQGRDGQLLVEMTQPPLPRGYVYNHGECWYHGQLRNDVMAQVKHGKAPTSKVIAKVWLADPVARVFRLLPSAQGFECSNVGYGV